MPSFTECAFPSRNTGFSYRPLCYRLRGVRSTDKSKVKAKSEGLPDFRFLSPPGSNQEIPQNRSAVCPRLCLLCCNYLAKCGGSISDLRHSRVSENDTAKSSSLHLAKWLRSVWFAEPLYCPCKESRASSDDEAIWRIGGDRACEIASSPLSRSEALPRNGSSVRLCLTPFAAQRRNRRAMPSRGFSR